jgi:putative ABC transport system substrate-binding protein
LSKLAAELVERRVAVIVAAGGLVTARRAKEATNVVPIVFVMGNDPVEAGVVASLRRPGGNVTGVTLFSAELGAKRVELLRQVAPRATHFGVLENPSNPNLPALLNSMQDSARSLGLQLVVERAGTFDELEAAFASFARLRVGALLVSPDPFFNSNRARVVALSTKAGIPTIYTLKDYVEAGGLMSYGSSFSGGYFQAGSYAGRILRGDRPGELPVLQPATFELAINLGTAKRLKLVVPPSLLQRADHVIE